MPNPIFQNKIARATFFIRSFPLARPPTSAQSTGQQLSAIANIVKIVCNCEHCKHCYCRPTSAQSTGGTNSLNFS